MPNRGKAAPQPWDEWRVKRRQAACSDDGDEARGDDGDASVSCYYTGFSCTESNRTCVKGAYVDDGCLAFYCGCSGKVVGGCSKLGQPIARLATAAERAKGTCIPSQPDESDPDASFPFDAAADADDAALD